MAYGTVGKPIGLSAERPTVRQGWAVEGRYRYPRSAREGGHGEIEPAGDGKSVACRNKFNYERIDLD